MKKIVIILAAVLGILLPTSLFSQDLTPDQWKEFYDNIEKQVEKYTTTLDLEDWQVFYVDSILTHDYKAMQDEIIAMSRQKVSNSDMYYVVQDKWGEKVYEAFHKIFNEQQWAKYLKNGGAKEKKARDKRAANAQK